MTKGETFEFFRTTSTMQQMHFRHEVRISDPLVPRIGRVQRFLKPGVSTRKRVWHGYLDLGLSVRRTRRKRLQRALRPRPILTAPNQEWAIDLASDVPASRRRLRIFSVVDCYGYIYTQPRNAGFGADHRVAGDAVAIQSDSGPER